jgi:hypothetical protein
MLPQRKRQMVSGSVREAKLRESQVFIDEN